MPNLPKKVAAAVRALADWIVRAHFKRLQRRAHFKRLQRRSIRYVTDTLTHSLSGSHRHRHTSTAAGGLEVVL